MAEKKDKDGREINTGGGAYTEGNVNTGGGDFVGRDKNISAPGGIAVGGNVTGSTMVVGNGNTVTGRVEGMKVDDVLKLVRELRAALPQAGLDEDTLEIVEGDIRVIETQLAKPEPKKHLVLPKLESVVATLTGLVGAGEAVQKLLPMAQQAAQWVQQMVK
jgi:hypothetical protein